MSKQTKGILLAASGASLWGISGAAAQYLFSTTTISNTWLVSIRLLVAGVLLTLWSLLKFPHQVKQVISSRFNLKFLVLFAVLGMMNSQLTYFLAIKYSNAPTTTVIQYLQPVFIILWLALANRQWPRRLDCISILIALVGTFFLATGGHLNQLALTPTALFWGIWCAVAAALYTLLPRPLLQKFDALIVCGLAMLISGDPPFAVVSDHPTATPEHLGLGPHHLHRHWGHDVCLHPLFAKHPVYLTGSHGNFECL